MSALGAWGLLKLGLSAARRESWLFVPLVVAESLAALLGLVPGLVLISRAFSAARTAHANEPAGALALGFLETLFDRSIWPVVAAGSVLAAAGAFLLRTLVRAGAARALYVANTSGADGRAAFSEAIVTTPARWLATALLSTILRVFATLAAVGSVVAGMAYFKANPGAAAALAMTIATAFLVTLPILDAALELGFVRSATLGETPVQALGHGLALAARRRQALVPAWATLVFLDLVVGLAQAAAVGSIGALPAHDGFWILTLGPRAFAWVVAAAGFALVTLVRLGAYGALVAEEAAALPVAPAPPPAEEPVYEAIEVPPDPAPQGS